MDVDAPYDRLAALPRPLWLPAIVASAGDTARRLADVKTWTDALARGELPPADADFADPPALSPLRRVVGELGLPALCRGVPSMAEQVLRTLLWHVDRVVDKQPRLQREAAVAEIVAEFTAEWTIGKADWESQLALMHELGDASSLRWDELRGLLARREWHEAQRLAALLEHLRPLADVIAALGREQHHPARPPRARPRSHGGGDARPMRLRETWLPDAPGELRGIRHSDRLERMLGSEAMQIRHPVLHKLWRARLAESRLLTYESEGVLVEAVPDPQPPAHGDADREPVERGPIILALDTSGSMRGAPENVAKAVALQALRIAHRERRGCRLIAFGGPDEWIERELNPRDGASGIEALLDLFAQSFDGGTDVQAPIERAVELVGEQQWSSADLLIVSDGEYGCTPAALARLDEARTRWGLRVQGILIGDRETMGLLETCDDIHWLRDWRRYTGATPQREAFVPVHTSSLTALYFPNALNPRASATATRRRGPDGAA